MLRKEQYSEQELVKGCVNNDRYCQEIFYRKYFPAMLRMVLRYTQDREVAMEIANTGFLRVFQKLDTFSFKGSLEGWVRRLVFHALSDHFRRKKEPVYFLDIEERDAPTNSNALSKLYFEDILSLVDKLPAASKEVFWLYAVEGYTHVEIAEKVNISVGTSKWHLSNARKKLKTLLDSYYNYKHYAG
ncbi:MAG: DNA-directed RNA polymerase sigma-70 factor [Saprospiraceae bacterium]|nr:MAG: DNA-directed RNA polymerase sigma-70 factor [Saprospiraceae bacterium]